VRTFCEENFPDAADQMITLEEEYENNPVGTITETRCFSYHYTAKESCTVLLGDSAHAIYLFIGDSAHAMYPFMGQNSFKIAGEARGTLANDLRGVFVRAQTSSRRSHGHGCQSRQGPMHHNLLAHMPYPPCHHQVWLAASSPLCSAVAFSAEPYGDCIKLEKQRMEQIGQTIGVLSYFLFAAVGIVAWAMFNGSADSSIAARARSGCPWGEHQHQTPAGLFASALA
jgi:hypothetical protein